jgi:mono/diheme cytochrome c family protein
MRQACAAALGAWLIAAAAAGQDAPARSVRDGVYTVAEAATGREQYTIFCANCHADDLAGTNSGDSGAPPLKYDGFMRGSTVGALFTKIRRSMPLDAPGTLPDEVVRDTIAYLLQQNGFPAGEAPLPQAVEALQAITIPNP